MGSVQRRPGGHRRVCGGISRVVQQLCWNIQCSSISAPRTPEPFRLSVPVYAAGSLI